MFERLLAPLLETLRPRFGLRKTQLETLAVLLVGLANGRKVNLTHLASQFPGYGLNALNYRRLGKYCRWNRCLRSPVLSPHQSARYAINEDCEIWVKAFGLLQTKPAPCFSTRAPQMPMSSVCVSRDFSFAGRRI